MDILLDTHAAKWFFDDDKNLSLLADEAIQNPANNVYVSIVSLWEIAIKISIGKLNIRGGINNFKTADARGYTSNVGIFYLTPPLATSIRKVLE